MGTVLLIIVVIAIAISLTSPNQEITSEYPNIVESPTPVTKISDDKDFEIFDILTYAFIPLLFILLTFIALRLSDISNYINKFHYDIESIASKIQILDKKTSKLDENNKDLKQSFQSANKDNFNLIQFPLDLNEKIDKFTKASVEYSKRVYQIVTVEQKEQLNEINESMKIFQESITAKSEELAQYKEGYDFSKKKNLIEGIIDNIMRVGLYKSKLSSSDEIALESLKYIEVSLLSLLNNNNVSQFDILVGSNALDQSDKCEVIPETKPTDDPSKIHMVHSVIDYGYQIQIKENESKLIKKAKVKVFGNS